MRAWEKGREWHRHPGFFCLVLAFLALPSDSTGFEQKEYLDGMSRIRVIVEFNTKDVESSGLSKGKMKNDVESRLRDSRIAVADGHDPSAPALFIGVSVTDVDTIAGGYRRIGYSYYLNLSVAEEAILPRNGRKLPVITWTRSTLGVSPQDGFVDDLGSKLGDLVDRFIADYPAGNR